MSGLDEISIGSLAKGIRGVTYKPHQLKQDVGEEDFFLLRSNNIQNGNVVFSDRQIVDKVCVSEKQKLIKGDIIVCMSNGSRPLVGKSALINLLDGNYCVGSFCSSFRSNVGVDPNFVFQVFRSTKFKNSIDVILSGSAINNLQNKHIEEIKFNLPSSLAEQTRIAKILSKADQAIEQTEKLIAKYQLIKTGLMQELLTKGIDEHGTIRNEKTHHFKTKQGLRVPEDWYVDVIDNLETDVLDFKANGSFETLTANVKYYYEQNYARLIRLTDLRNGLKYEGVFIDEKGFQFLKKTRLVEGDILISCVGEYTGFVCQMPKVPYHATIAPNMFVVRFKDNIVNSFAYRYMNSSQFQNQILVVSTSSATKLLNNPNLRSLKLAIPPKEEQIEIAKKFDKIEKLIHDCKISLEKLQSLKTALMQDLLSGKVRVKIKEIEMV